MSIFRAIDVDNYPKEISSNCLAFALGQLKSVSSMSELYNLDYLLPIDKAFEKKVEGFGFDNLRRIHSIKELIENEYGFIVFGFKPYKVTLQISKISLTYYDFHVIRRELDGTWVHKPGWNANACIMQKTDWKNIYEEFDGKHVLFAMEGKPCF